MIRKISDPYLVKNQILMKTASDNDTDGSLFDEDSDSDEDVATMKLASFLSRFLLLNSVIWGFYTSRKGRIVFLPPRRRTNRHYLSRPLAINNISLGEVFLKPKITIATTETENSTTMKGCTDEPNISLTA